MNPFNFILGKHLKMQVLTQGKIGKEFIMNTRGKINVIIILSIVLFACIVFAVVLTLQGREGNLPTEDVQEKTDEVEEKSEPTQETLEEETSSLKDEKAEYDNAGIETQQFTVPEAPTEPATQSEKDDKKSETVPSKESQPVEQETVPPTEDIIDPTQPQLGAIGNAQWGNAPED